MTNIKENLVTLDVLQNVEKDHTLMYAQMMSNSLFPQQWEMNFKWQIL